MPKKKKIKKAGIPDPFDTSSHMTERTASGVLMHWMRDLIEEKNIDLGLPNIETGGSDRKFPDTIINKTRRSQNALCVMEFKPPYWDPFQEDDPRGPARNKAARRRAPYFVTSNFQTLILWNTEKANAGKPDEEQIVARYHLSDVVQLDAIEEHRYKKSTIAGLRQFLADLHELSTGKKAEQRLAIDEFLIYRLQEKIHKLAHYYESIIYDAAHKDPTFAKRVAYWFNDQGWSFFIENEHDYEKIARQTAYLLVNKILFYNALQRKRPGDLPPLEIPESITKSGMLKGVLQTYFNEVLKIDYQTIYTTDFIDEVAFLESKEIVEEVKELIRVLIRYDFSTLGFDIIGRVFEQLIPHDERHNLGQYFTNPDVVDLILRFCLQHEDDKVFDPSCGAGTFLVRSYQHKKLMNQRLAHEKILNDIWGNDIAKFPAHLATINLAINDLGVEQNYPNIIQRDFFDLRTTDEGFELPESVRQVKARALDINEREVVHPRWFDAVVGNPPYTRQEEISEISNEETYKDKLIQKALGQGEKEIANISRRAGIYAYFFIHGSKFLRNGGRFGFVVSNAWLDVEYGAGLQEFFLKNYKIVAVIESKVERWFEDADINTIIVILEKTAGNDKKKERDDNLVRFAYLSKPLRHFIPAGQNIWEREIERKQAVDNLIKTILGHSELYQNDELRIFPKKQSELWEEGFDEESQKYTGAKWGKYLRAPEIFFKILEKGKRKLVPLKQVADVRRGLTTGANEFFYLTEEEIKRHKIEKNFWMHKDRKGKLVPNYVIRSPRECKSIIVNPDDLTHRVLMIHKDKKKLQGTNLLKYLLKGEQREMHQRPTCASRTRWYDLDEIKAPLLSRRFIDKEFSFQVNSKDVFIGDTFFAINPRNIDELFLAACLNSTLSAFLLEVYGRTPMGQGVLLIYGPEIKPLPVLHKRISPAHIKLATDKFKKLALRKQASILKEVEFNNVKQDRRALDKVIMGDILGLTEDEQLEVYRAVVDLVKSRLERARSVDSRYNNKSGIDIESIVNAVVEKVGANDLKNWYKENILCLKRLCAASLPEIMSPLNTEEGLFGWQIKNGKQIMQCQSESEARYLKIWMEASVSSIKIPKDEGRLKRLVASLEKRKAKIDEVIEDYLGSILDAKLKARILHQVWQRLA